MERAGRDILGLYHHLLKMGGIPDIVYEDEDILAVNKPSGLSVHSDGKTETATLADWILETHPEMKDVGEPLILDDGRRIQRPGIVHRLDKETSGILVLAKNQHAFLHLKKQFQNREVEKTYNAFVYGEPRVREGTIDVPIGKSKRDFRLRAAGVSAGGLLREAITKYKVLKSAKDCAYVEVYPKTGRMHQIRVHFKSIRHPVVCDRLYAPARVRTRAGGPRRPCLLGFERLALHARVVSIRAPSGERLILEAPLPPDFERALSLFS